VSAFGIGEASQLLSVRNVEPGQAIVLACSIDGTMRDDFPFFASFEQRRALMAGDVRVLADVAAAREAVAAKDVSMAGLIGSLAMLLEARQAGAHLRLETVPVPEGVDAARWLISFPAYAFLLCTRPDSVEACTSRFAARGLTAVQIGEVTGSGELVVTDGDESETFVRFPHDRITGLTPP
jgi:selenophosphate synthetase-related protein